VFHWPPRTNNRPSSPTVCVPGKVCNAAIIFPAEPAVVTISNGFSTETLDLSPASKVPAVMTTASSAFTLSEFDGFILKSSYINSVLKFHKSRNSPPKFACRGCSCKTKITVSLLEAPS
jgi:hypothetical protein